MLCRFFQTSNNIAQGVFLKILENLNVAFLYAPFKAIEGG